MKTFLVFFEDSKGMKRYFKITTDNLIEDLPRYMSLYDSYKGITTYKELESLVKENPDKQYGIMEVSDDDNYAIINYVKPSRSKSGYYMNNLVAKLEMQGEVKETRSKYNVDLKTDRDLRLIEL